MYLNNNRIKTLSISVEREEKKHDTQWPIGLIYLSIAILILFLGGRS